MTESKGQLSKSMVFKQNIVALHIGAWKDAIGYFYIAKTAVQDFNLFLPTSCLSIKYFLNPLLLINTVQLPRYTIFIF